MISNLDIEVVAVIPAHLSSVRLPRKILLDLYGIPMIEHVRRRALMCQSLSRVIVATCDDEIATVIKGFGGDVVMTSPTHTNGTSRAAEALHQVNCTHVVLIQGDEPLLLPSHVNTVVDYIHSYPTFPAWNATAPLNNHCELDTHSFVKCALSTSGHILNCFRRTPYISEPDKQLRFVRKILGIIAYRKDFLQSLVLQSPTPIEQSESIEQMRILETDHQLLSVPVSPSLPSINEPSDVEIVLQALDSISEQRKFLDVLLQM